MAIFLHPSGNASEKDFLDELRVKLISPRGKVCHAVLPLLVEENRDVAKLEIAIYQDDRGFFIVKDHSQVDSQHGAAGASLWAVNRDDLAITDI